MSRYAELSHLASKQHRDNVDKFWNDTGAYLIKNTFNKRKSQFCFSDVQYSQVTKYHVLYHINLPTHHYSMLNRRKIRMNLA